MEKIQYLNYFLSLGTTMKIRRFCLSSLPFFPPHIKKTVLFILYIKCSFYELFIYLFICFIFKLFFSFNKELTIMYIFLFFDFCIFSYQWRNITYLLIYSLQTNQKTALYGSKTFHSLAQACSEPFQISKMECFAKIVNGFQLFS